jgi:hypothetical protein
MIETGFRGTMLRRLPQHPVLKTSVLAALTA